MAAIRKSTIDRNWGRPAALSGWRRDLAADPGHLAYARAMARRFARLGPDAAGVAYLALCRAALEYDAGRGVKFTTYATPFIRFALLESASIDACRGLGVAVRDRRRRDFRPPEVLPILDFDHPAA